MTTVTLASGDLLLRGIPQDVQERAAAVARRAGMTLTDSGTLPAMNSLNKPQEPGFNAPK